MGKAQQAGSDDIPSSAPYLDIVSGVLRFVLQVAYAHGYDAGFDRGMAAGLMLPEPPPEGTFAHRSLERDTVREALWPEADTLGKAIAAHLRELERQHLREAERERPCRAVLERDGREYDCARDVHDTSVPHQWMRQHHRGDYGAPHNAQTVLGNGDGGTS